MTSYTTESARQDIRQILHWTQRRFGEAARIRYQALISTAIRDISRQPDRPGVRERPEIAEGTFTYHLSFSRDRAGEGTGRVKRPRHLLIFRSGDSETIEIVRVLHDSMELSRHLP